MGNKTTLADLNSNLAIAQATLDGTDKTDLQAVIVAKEQVRKAREDLRIFSYKAHQALTPSGKVIRR